MKKRVEKKPKGTHDWRLDESSDEEFSRGFDARFGRSPSEREPPRPVEQEWSLAWQKLKMEGDLAPLSLLLAHAYPPPRWVTNFLSQLTDPKTKRGHADRLILDMMKPCRAKTEVHKIAAAEAVQKLMLESGKTRIQAFEKVREDHPPPKSKRGASRKIRAAGDEQTSNDDDSYLGHAKPLANLPKVYKQIARKRAGF